MRDYVLDIDDFTDNVDRQVVAGIVRYLGIALLSPDASRVSCSDSAELRRVREGFLRKKLRLEHTDSELDAALHEICERLGTTNPHKLRVTVYYLLAERFGKLDIFRP